MSVLDWALVLILVLGAVAVLLSWTAGRLDRMHIRLTTAQASLDRHLVDRAACVRSVAAGGLLDPAGALIAVESADAARTSIGRADHGERESELSDVLRTVFGDPEDCRELWSRSDDAQRALLADLANACERVRLARRFHSDLVERTRTMRRRPVVRVAHLAGHAPWPQDFAMDDRPPGPFTGD